MLTDDAQLFSRPKEMNLFVTDCKYGLTETDVKHILKMKKGKKIWRKKTEVNKAAVVSQAEFTEILNSIINERFPGTQRYIINGGDYWKDIVMELRRGAGKLRYSPYQLFKQSDDYENTIQEFILRWEKEINS